MTAWNYSVKQLYRLALVLLTLEYFYHLKSCFTTETFKSVPVLLEEMKYSMRVASNHLNTTLSPIADSHCISTALTGQALLL